MTIGWLLPSLTITPLTRRLTLIGCSVVARRPLKTYAFDHNLPEGSEASSLLVVYIDPSAPDALLATLLALRTHAQVQVLLRYKAPGPAALTAAETNAPTPLAGWGVEMVLKKMEYSSVDDRTQRAAGAESMAEEKADGAGYQSLFFEDQLGPVSWEQNKIPLTEEQLDSAAPLLGPYDDERGDLPTDSMHQFCLFRRSRSSLTTRTQSSHSNTSHRTFRSTRAPLPA